MDVIDVENLPTTKKTTANDVIFGIINGILSAIKIDDVATTDFAKLQNLPFTLITEQTMDISKFSRGTYLVASNEIEIVDKGSRCCFLSKGALIFVVEYSQGSAAVVQCGAGTFYVDDTKNAENWELTDYYPALSEVEGMISSIDMTDIDVSQSLVKFKSIDDNNLSMTLKEFAEAMMQYFQSYDEQIYAKQDKIVLGDGLKWQNGKLCLDIENGDNLKYGTSTAQAEVINENEVTANE